MKNKKGQMVMFGLMMMLFIIATAVVLIQPMREIVNDFRTDRDCGNSSITTNEKVTCTIVDFYLPYFLATLIAGSAVYVFYRTAVAG
jgi:hypothetical protein